MYILMSSVKYLSILAAQLLGIDMSVLDNDVTERYNVCSILKDFKLYIP